jgi:hypothetical protein
MNNFAENNLYVADTVRTFFWVSIVTVLIGWGALSSEAMALDLQMLGLRGGISDHRNKEDFTQYDGFATM